MRTRLFCLVFASFMLAGPVAVPAEVGRTAPKQQPPAAKSAVSFVTDVMPVVDRLGCNSIQCHGSVKGKGGLRLSLFGGDPDRDYDALTKAAEGRRIDSMEPARSLVLLKATGAVKHGGAEKIRPDSADYRLLLAWIAGGAAKADEKAPKVVAVQVLPEEIVLSKGQTQQIRVTAIYADGTRKDVSVDAHYQSVDGKLASVDGGGKVKAEGFGQGAVFGKYLRQSGAARVVVPQPLPSGFPEVKPYNRIDELVLADLKKMGIPPSGLSTDQEFLRRVCLDVLGELPAPDAVRAFLASKDPLKRNKLIDELMEREEFAEYWALKWGDLLRIKSEFPVKVWPKGSHTYYQWVRRAIRENKPYDQFVRELLMASGSNFRHGEVNFFRANPSKDPQTIAESTAVVFMGIRIGCARCHAHPTESWTLEDNLGLAAFFSKVGFKSTTEWKEEIVYVNRKGALRRPRTGEIVKPKYFGGDVLEMENPEEDPRGKFVAWLIRPENPYFVKNIVNRVWSWFLGRGIIHEPDDLRPTNLPSNPQLLAFLEKDFVAHKYDLKYLFRQILQSRTYQLSSRVSALNKIDSAHFSHFYLRRLTAEELLDAISRITETFEPFFSPIPEPYTRLPQGYRSVQLYDGDITAPFLELFGRPSRDTPFECERNLETSMRQALHLINSEHIQSKINSGARLQRWLKEKTSDEQIVEELYLLSLARLPAPEEKKKLAGFLAEQSKQRTQAIQDVVWVILNSSEFLFNH